MVYLDLYEGDCLEVMKDLSANSIDCFICDLPYGCMITDPILDKLSSSNCCYSKQKWDVKINLEDFWNQVKRLMKSKNTPILMFCSMRFYGELYASNPKWFRYGLIWKKQRGTNFMDANIKPLCNYEMIAVFSKQTPYFVRKEGPCALSVLEYPYPKKKKHPTEKPRELYRWLIERYCPEGGTILDPTAGSFNSCFEAYALNRNAIGIEKDDKFYKKASEEAEKL